MVKKSILKIREQLLRKIREKQSNLMGKILIIMLSLRVCATEKEIITTLLWEFL
ncbi:MAG: hypothetical protein J7J51_00510 [Candidatus Omnitrophica bacterium]|nr:hypothetical protein [Candidatus Omnitrophota bacterium]